MEDKVTIKRNTIQKQLIYNAVINSHRHPTAEEVYEQVYLAHPGISKSTVYRNLKVLTEEEKIKKVSIPGSPDKYDGNIGEHYHAICKECGRFIDLDFTPHVEIDFDDDELRNKHIDEYSLLFYGICDNCQDISVK